MDPQPLACTAGEPPPEEPHHGRRHPDQANQHAVEDDHDADQPEAAEGSIHDRQGSAAASDGLEGHVGPGHRCSCLPAAATGPVPGGAPDVVHVVQGGIERAEAQEINVRQGGIARADATDIAVSMGGVALARAERVSVEMGGIGAALAGEARLSQGYARLVIAREANVEQGLIGTLITGKATIQRSTGVLLLVAGRVDGPVKAVFDWRGGSRSARPSACSGRSCVAAEADPVGDR